MKLTRREKTSLAIAALALVLASFYIWLLRPIQTRMAYLSQSIPRKERELKELALLRNQYLSLLEKKRGMEAKLSQGAQGFSVFSFLEREAARLKIQDKIASMRPYTLPAKAGYKGSGVELKIEAISLKELVQSLYQIENGPQPIRVEYMRIRIDPGGKNLLDVTLRVLVYEPVGS